MEKKDIRPGIPEAAPVSSAASAPETSIYGKYKDTLDSVMQEITGRITAHNERIKEESGDGIYEHLNARIKSEASMREKCDRKGLPQTPESALHIITDSIGLRIVTRFIDDIYSIIDYLKSFPDVTVRKEKDYIRHAKPNGYRSYHMILELTVPYEDVLGRNPGHYFVEIQLRTIAMDMWASLEHQLKYKHSISNEKRITTELKRCADELASCDVSMQTIRNLINENSKTEQTHSEEP